MNEPPSLTAEELIDDFEFLDTKEERLKLIIELGRELPDLPEPLRREEFKVQGCQSQVWLVPEIVEAEGAPKRIVFQADSDAHIVKGLVGILVMLLSGKTPQEILDFDLRGLFDQLKLEKHLVPARSNGLHSMVRRINEIAATVA
ncbi:SufE family protein [Bremerella cremea]|uniref:SufE family protein n=1 Tax=Bremerella cremea TaxID=1031537 RepID=UPI0031F014F5